MEDLSNGSYVILLQLFSAGTHDIVVTDSCQTSSVFGRVHVTSSTPCGASCKFADSNSYRATVGVRHCISVELFDEFGNPAHYDVSDGGGRGATWWAGGRTRTSSGSGGGNILEMIHKMEATVGGQRLSAYTGPEALCYKFVASGIGTTRVIVFVFTPQQAGQRMLNVSVNHTPLSACPVPFTVTAQVSLARVNGLRRFLRGVATAAGCTPTLTVERGERLLESAVEVLQLEGRLSRMVRIRFGDEIGIDMGGVAR